LLTLRQFFVKSLLKTFKMPETPLLIDLIKEKGALSPFNKSYLKSFSR